MRTGRIADMTTIITTMAAVDATPGELPLYIWLSPAFPVGAFAYSHGLEWAVEAGDISNVKSLVAWLETLCGQGAPRCDAILFAAAHKAVARRDWAALRETNELAVALTGGKERRLESVSQGGAFVIAARAAWNCEALAYLTDDETAYAIAVGAVAAGHGFRLEAALSAFVVALFSNLVSASVRLSAIGQTDGQRALAALLPRLTQMATECAVADLSELGSCSFRSDIAAMKHETQYSRLFRS
jgi:urease accessory protein